MGTGLYLKRATTARYYLGPQDGGTTFTDAEFKLWFPPGDLPVGSILKSVSADIRLDSATGDSWASDLTFVLANGTPVLQIGGYYNLLDVTTRLYWNPAGDDGPGTRFTDRKLVVTDFPDAIDLNGTSVYLWNGYEPGGPASWSGWIDFTWEPTA